MTATAGTRPAVALPYGAPEPPAPRPHPHIHAPQRIVSLLGRAVTWTAPTDLGPCEQCDVVGRAAVATVTWPDGSQSTGTTMIRACRTCLVEAVAVAEESAGRDAVEVHVPGWRPVDLPRTMTGLTARQAWTWVAARYLHTEDDPTPGSGYERGLLCADEVVACAVIAALRVLGVEPAGARLLWDHSPGIVAGILADARENGPPRRPPVGPDGQVYAEVPEPRPRAPRSTCPLCGGQGHPAPPNLCRCQQ